MPVSVALGPWPGLGDVLSQCRIVPSTSADSHGCHGPPFVLCEANEHNDMTIGGASFSSTSPISGLDAFQPHTMEFIQEAVSGLVFFHQQKRPSAT